VGNLPSLLAEKGNGGRQSRTTRMQGLGPQSTKSHDTKAGRLHDGMSIRPTVGDLQEDEELGQNRKSARQKIERRVMATGLAVGRAHTSGIPVSLLDLRAPLRQNQILTVLKTSSSGKRGRTSACLPREQKCSWEK
jgi:hypothetical protein